MPRCMDCEHLFHDKEKRVSANLLSCRVRQSTPEQRATYMGVHFERTCPSFVVRLEKTVNPMVAAEAYQAEFAAECRKGMVAPSPVAKPVAAPVVAPLPLPVAPAPISAHADPFDLGPPVPRKAPVPTPEAFTLEAA